MTELGSNWSIHLAHALWQGTAAGLLVLAFVRLFPGTSPRLRHALVSLALLKFVLPPMLPLPTGLFSAAPPMPELRLVRDAVALDGPVLVALMLIHAAGVVFVLARLAHEAFRLHRICRRATRGGQATPSVLDRQDCLSSTILITDEVTVPMTTGRFILIPHVLYGRLTAAELGHVLAHEREHVRRRDVRTSVLQSLVAAIWWFHPLVHLLVREARMLREECCDDAVSRDDRAGYAATLLHAASCISGPAPAAAAAIAESPHSLVPRIRRMASARYAPSPRLGLAARALVLLAALLLLPGLRVSQHNRVAFDHTHHHAPHH